MIENGYKRVITNELRRATSTAAGLDGEDAHSAVSHLMSHSVDTARKNYVVQSETSAVAKAKIVERVQANARAVSYASSNLKELRQVFSGSLPTKESLQEFFRKSFKIDFDMSDESYATIRDHLLFAD